jgi:hypothetical protein
MPPRLPGVESVEIRNRDRGTNLVKDVLQTLLGKGRTFDILDGAELLCKSFAGLGEDRSLPLPRELFDDLRVVSQIYLGTDD